MLMFAEKCTTNKDIRYMVLVHERWRTHLHGRPNDLVCFGHTCKSNGGHMAVVLVHEAPAGCVADGKLIVHIN